MKIAIGGIIALFVIIILVIITVFCNVRSKEESKFLKLFNTLNKIKKLAISCRQNGSVRNSYSCGKASCKSKTDILVSTIVDYIKIFSDANIDILSNYLIEARKKIIIMNNSFYSQIDSLLKDNKEIINYTNKNFDSIASLFFSNNDEDLNQKGVNYFDKIDNDINNFIDEIIINLIKKYSSIKTVKITSNNELESFMTWLKSYLKWQKLVPLIIGTFSSICIGILVNYISFLIMQ